MNRYGYQYVEEENTKIEDTNSQFNKCCLCNAVGHLINSCTDNIRFETINSYRENILDMGNKLSENKYILNGTFDSSQETNIKNFVQEFWSGKLSSMEKNSLKAICIFRKINNSHHSKQKLINYIIEDILKTCFTVHFEIQPSPNTELKYQIVGDYNNNDIMFSSGYESVDSMIELYTIINNKEKELPESIECPICYETIGKKEIIHTNCGHDYCKPCIKKVLSFSHSKKCAICRTKIGKELECNNPELKEKYICIKKEKSSDSESESDSDSEYWEDDDDDGDETITWNETRRRLLNQMSERMEIERASERHPQRQRLQ
jgi:hypothetical protein